MRKKRKFYYEIEVEDALWWWSRTHHRWINILKFRFQGFISNVRSVKTMKAAQRAAEAAWYQTRAPGSKIVIRRLWRASKGWQLQEWDFGKRLPYKPRKPKCRSN